MGYHGAPDDNTAAGATFDRDTAPETDIVTGDKGAADMWESIVSLGDSSFTANILSEVAYTSTTTYQAMPLTPSH